MKRNCSLLFSLLLALATVVAVGCSAGDSKGGMSKSGISYSPFRSSRARLASALLAHPNAEFANYHVSGKRDNATALDNIRQTAAGMPAACSSYGRAPGGYTKLSPQMLRALKVLADKGYKFHVTSLAGSSHSSRSRHYLGVAFDVNRINGVRVCYGSPYWREFMRLCRDMGATETLGPGDPGHSTHIHVAWPRPRGQ
ncbi:hypothetical protein [Roseibacillus ishigakijimensis]|uniref:Peptidase M15 n=1 Tax=Roseibacillus ishigakijimensis TaxID=454146 RepID=A0A934RP83_9BACT|nr:hypothetical protein [Roseibacillus ishigakijimensis]MBK1835462.1 hypothetical protein [Roseibacillus ishigakijimensis]